jgi:hypothetical protein
LTGKPPAAANVVNFTYGEVTTAAAARFDLSPSARQILASSEPFEYHFGRYDKQVFRF